MPSELANFVTGLQIVFADNRHSGRDSGPMRAVSTVLLAATSRTLAGSRPTRRAACRMRSCTRATFCAIERTLSELCVSYQA